MRFRFYLILATLLVNLATGLVKVSSAFNFLARKTNEASMALVDKAACVTESQEKQAL